MNVANNGVAAPEKFGPWNPGLSSVMPVDVERNSTIYRSENVFQSFNELRELSEFCGLAKHEIAAFRPERLIVHEVLLRVTADFSVYDGRLYEDLGINARRIVACLISTYINPQRDSLAEVDKVARARVGAFVKAQIDCATRAPVSAPSTGATHAFWSRFTRRKPQGRATAPEDSAARLNGILAQWQQRAHDGDALERACCDALYRVVNAITRKHGRLVGEADLIASIAGNIASNTYAAQALGTAVEPLIQQGVKREGFHTLPHQPKPVVMNVKGASAAGKSTLRPLQQKLAQRIGVPWEDFALISPDIWRKYLLDYRTLGAAYKYAGMMTGYEIEIIDRKLDQYMARKAAQGGMTHLLIDRFRFDSFVPEDETNEPVRLLTRFGDLIYMFFMITPPEATVERAWKRGQMVGRYKAVDDLLYHNVEAFSGMPELFYGWALRKNRRVHFEFLDNSVTLGSLPRTVAYGWNDELNILSVKGMIDVDRFRKLNVDAKNPDDVYASRTMTPKDNAAFLRACAKRMAKINFADPYTGRIYAHMDRGRWIWRDRQALRLALTDQETRDGLEAIDLPNADDWPEPDRHGVTLDSESAHTLGAWGALLQSPAAGNFAR